MTSPDLPTELQLNIGTLTEQQLVDAAIAGIQLRIPDWQPLEGNTEVALIEGLAVLINWYQYSLNRLGPIVMDGLLDLYGVSRKPGGRASGTIVATVPPSIIDTRTVPAGTRWRVEVGDGTTVDMLTVEAVTTNLTESGGTITMAVVADEYGTRPNGIPVGTTADLIDPVLAWVESAETATAPFAGGTAPEADSVFYPRAALVLRRSSTALVLPDHFTSAAMDYAAVGRALTVNNWLGTGTVGDDYGHVTVAVVSPSGGAVGSGDLADVQAALTARAVGGVTVHVQNANIVNYTASVTVNAEPGVDHTSLQTELQAYLRAWVNPLVWPFGGVLYGNALIAYAAQYPGVARVTAVSGASVDAAQSNPTTVPQVNPSVTVTVNP